MTTHPRRRTVATLSTAALLSTLLVPLTATGAAAVIDCDVHWTGGGDGSTFADEDNWDAAVPDADDIACIDDGDTSLPIVVRSAVEVGAFHVEGGLTGPVLQVATGGSLRLLGPSSTADGDLLLGDDTSGTDDPTLEVDDTLTIGGDLAFLRGRLTGAGTTTVDGEMTGPSISRTRAVQGHELRLEGGGELSPTGFFVEQGGEVVNLGELRMSSPGAVQVSPGEGPGTLRNEGTFVHSSTATNWIATTFDNVGTVEVTDGELRLDGPGTNTGTMAVGPDGTLNFARAVISMAAAYVNASDGEIIGDGTVRITQFAGLRSEGTYDVAATEATRPGLQSSVGTWAVDGDTGTLLIDGGALRGQDSGLQTSGDVEFRRGSMDRDGSVFGSLGFVGDVGGDLTLTSGGLKDLRTLTRFTIGGRADHDAGEVRLQDDALLSVEGAYRQTGGLVDLRRATLGASSIQVETGARLQGGWLLDTSELEIMGGTFAPGIQPFSPFGFGAILGTVDVTGDLDLGGTFIVRVADVDTHDQVAAEGRVWLDGTLEVLFDTETDLPVGTRLPIVTSEGVDGRNGVSPASEDLRTDQTSVLGTFATTDLPELDGDRELTVEYTDDTVFLVVADTSSDDVVDDDPVVEDTPETGDPDPSGPAIEVDGDGTVRVATPTGSDPRAAQADELPATGGPETVLALLAVLALAAGAPLTRRGTSSR